MSEYQDPTIGESDITKSEGAAPICHFEHPVGESSGNLKIRKSEHLKTRKSEHLKSQLKYETEFFLKFYVNEKCVKSIVLRKLKIMNFQTLLVFPSPSQGRQEDRVQGVHSVAGPPRRIGTRKSL